MTAPSTEQERGGVPATVTAVTLMGIGSVVAKASDIAGPVLAFHRAWRAAVLYVGLFLALGGRIARPALRAAQRRALLFLNGNFVVHVMGAGGRRRAQGGGLEAQPPLHGSSGAARRRR